MNNPNRPSAARIRPLASIPMKEGFVIVGVRPDGTEAELVVFLDHENNYRVPGYHDLVGWKLP